MSTFRPEPGPQQPRIYFTPGQPLAIPNPIPPDQRQAWRARPEFLQPPTFAVPPPAAAFVPSTLIQIPASSRQEIAPLLEQFEVFTPGTPGSVPPAPLQMQRERRGEFLQPATFLVPPPAVTLVPGPVVQVPTSSRQEIAPLLEQLEIFIPAAPVGVQAAPLQILRERRGEILQPATFLVPPRAFVPSAATQAPASSHWPMEWLIDFLQPEWTPGPATWVPPLALQRLDGPIYRFDAALFMPPTFLTPSAALVPLTDVVFMKASWDLRLFHALP